MNRRSILLEIFYRTGIGLAWLCSLSLQAVPSVDSLNQQMDELERLLGVPGSSMAVPPTVPISSNVSPFNNPKASPHSTSPVPPVLRGIERKLEELESMVGDLPGSEIVKEVANDPWAVSDSNLSVPLEMMPRIEVSRGMVVRYIPESNSFLPVQEGEIIKVRTLLVIPSGSTLVVSFTGKSAVRFDENSRAVLGPPVNNRQMIDLRNGTVSAYLNPDRDPQTSPRFGIRSRSGTVEATGTFYAVTEYKGQAYTAVKKGTVKKIPSPPTQADFATYLQRSSSLEKVKPAEKNNSN